MLTVCALASTGAVFTTGRIPGTLLSVVLASELASEVFAFANFSTSAFNSSIVFRCAASSPRNWLTSSLVALPGAAPDPSVLLAGSVP